MIFMILLILVFFAFLSNNYITISRQCLTCRKSSGHMHPLSIVHISDLHNKNFGFRQNILIAKIRALHPDIIAVTGDLVDHAPFRNSMIFIQKASRICPVYYIRGNHESIAGNYAEQERHLLKHHVHILKNTSALFTKYGRTYQITGLDDPKFQGYNTNYWSVVKKTLDQLTDMKHPSDSEPDFHILLAHRPDLFHLYSSYPFDLVLCGHAHGGQFRLPFTDGLYAPNQGILPKYASGMHAENGTAEVISRGLGNSSFPLRLFNFPEIVHVIIR